MPTDAPSPTGGRREFYLTLVGSLLLRLLACTWRYRVADPERLRQMMAGKPCILTFWHNRLLLIPVLWNRYLARDHARRTVPLTSTSRDGELIAQFLDRFGIGSARGSATRRGAAALRELAGWLKLGHVVAVTPDGSRGPIYEVKGGLLVLARISGQPIQPISWDCSRAWRVRSWDRLIIPKPFARVTLRLGEPFLVPRDGTPEEMETQRQRCEEVLLNLAGLK